MNRRYTLVNQAKMINQAVVTAGIFPKGEVPESHFEVSDGHLHIGPYAIPGQVAMGGVGSVISFMLNAKAQVEIAKQLADFPPAKPRTEQDALFEQARTSLESSALDPEQIRKNVEALISSEPVSREVLYGTHYDIIIDPPKNISTAPAPYVAQQPETARVASLEQEGMTDVYGATQIGAYGIPEMSDWIQTYTGKKFHVITPNQDDICIEDIAHALSLVNRYTGHTSVAYSVAEHSVRVMECVMEMLPEPSYGDPMGNIMMLPTRQRERWKIVLAALLHDASEAYLADIARPIKMIPAMQPYRDLEKGLEIAVAAKYGVEFPWPKIVKRADEILLVTEKRDLMGPSPAAWVLREEPLPGTIKPWAADLAEYRFIQEFRLLLDRIKNPR